MVVFITTAGDHHQCGYQQGEQLREEIGDAVDAFFRSKMMSEVGPKLIPRAFIKVGLGILGKRNIKKPIQKYLPNQYAKIQAVAKGASISKRLSYGLHFVEVLAGYPKAVYQNPPAQQDAPPIMSCTMLFAKEEATADGSMIFGRNYDFPNILQPFQMVRDEQPDDGYRNITMSQYPWVSSHVGLNEKGLAIGFNFGRSWKKEPLDFRLNGVPSTLLLQESLERFATTAEVVEFITQFPARTNGGFYGVIDRSGETCVIETTSTRHALRRPSHGILPHTNTYRSESIVDANLPDSVLFKMDGIAISPICSPKMRYQRATELLSKYHGDITVETIKRILSDHHHREPDMNTICTHGPQGSTLASMIIKPSEGTFLVTDDQPCQSEYKAFSIPLDA